VGLFVIPLATGVVKTELMLEMVNTTVLSKHACVD
jgi:hypothetical protein